MPDDKGLGSGSSPDREPFIAIDDLVKKARELFAGIKKRWYSPRVLFFVLLRRDHQIPLLSRQNHFAYRRSGWSVAA